MKLIKQTCEPYIQSPGIDGIYKQIERCGRVCYKSESNITENSAKPFVDRMIKSNHLSMLEQSTMYFDISVPSVFDTEYLRKINIINFFKQNKYSKINKYNKEHNVDGTIVNIEHYAITTNYRVFVEQIEFSELKETTDGYFIGVSKEYLLKFLCDPTEYHEKRYTFKCTTALHCYKDLTRHRKFSFAIESTRYCNYSNTGRFGEMTFILPIWIKESADKLQNSNIFAYRQFYEYLENVEKTYDSLIEEGWKAQEAAEVLPQCIKADMIITGFEDDWRHLLNLRYKGTTGAPHPMVKELATLIKNELEKQGFKYEC